MTKILEKSKIDIGISGNIDAQNSKNVCSVSCPRGRCGGKCIKAKGHTQAHWCSGYHEFY